MADVTKPLMSDYKESQPSDTESLPSYRINEAEEQLVVGKENQKKSCAVGRFFRCCKSNTTNGEEPARRRFKKKRRAFIWIFSFLALLVMGATFAVHRCHSAIGHAIECVPITELTTSLTLPLASENTRVFLHASLTTGDTHIVHSDDVNEGSIKISFTLPEGTVIKENDDEGDDKPSLFVCQAHKDRFVGAGIHNREKGQKTPEVVSTTVTLAKDARTPPIFLPGEGHHSHGFMHRKWMKAVRKAERKAIQKIEKAKSKFRSPKHEETEDWEVIDA
ncbi:hypothetical protein FRC02_008972 [Tulasnella sp. 418]|nr:hypothetical protein FRC02_008972 [Tulasnella sp. 418]